MDELSYRKGHKYVTIVTDLDAHRIVWVVEGRKAKDLDGFFDALGPKGVAALEVAAIDMSKAFQAALRQRAPHVDVVFDRFHVQKLVHDAIDELRRGLVAKATDPAQKEALKKTRRAIQRSPRRLSRKDLDKLKTLVGLNAPLYRARSRAAGDLLWRSWLLLGSASASELLDLVARIALQESS